jgi:hypothetical protein
MESTYPFGIPILQISVGDFSHAEPNYLKESGILQRIEYYLESMP